VAHSHIQISGHARYALIVELMPCKFADSNTYSILQIVSVAKFGDSISCGSQPSSFGSQPSSNVEDARRKKCN